MHERVPIKLVGRALRGHPLIAGSDVQLTPLPRVLHVYGGIKTKRGEARVCGNHGWGTTAK